MYYSSFGLLSLPITLIIGHNTLFRMDAQLSPARVKYKRFLLSVLFYYLADILWGVLYEFAPTSVAYADTVFYFAAMVLSVLLWTRFVIVFLNRENIFGKFLHFIAWAIFAVEIIVLIINFVKPIAFRFDENGTYVTELGRSITLGSQIALFFITACYTLFVVTQVDGREKRHYRAVGYSGLIMTTFIVLQTVDPFLPYYAMGCLVATCLMHSFVIEDEREDHRRELNEAMHKIYLDPLTGVKSNHAYLEAKAMLDEKIAKKELGEFALVIFDLNDLKKINDTEGHDAGDRFIKNAARLICKYFNRSPVYRIGGAEFAAFLTGEDYENRTEILEAFERQIDRNHAEGILVVISSGLGDYLPGTDKNFNTIFERADRQMYMRKRYLTEMV